MLKKIQRTITIVAAGLALAVAPAAVVAGTAYAATAPTIDSCLSQGSGLQTGNGGDCAADTSVSGSDKIQSLVNTIINVFSIVVGIVAVIMIIVGGFKYITSGGDSGNITGAKNTIMYAIIGLVVVALAQFLVKFVLEKVTTP